MNLTAQNGKEQKMNCNGNDHRELIEALARSPVFRDFERSFTEATGLAVALVPVQSWHLTFCGHRKENPFCALLSSCRRASAACLETQEKLAASATRTARTITCAAGLCETAAPVRVGNQLIGFLRTGQIRQTAPSPKQLQPLKRLVQGWGLSLGGDALRAVYSRTPFLARKQYDAMVHLLNLFAQHLSVLSNQLLLRQANAGAVPPIIARARAFIEEHFTEQLSLREVAAASGVSLFHFCKLFKRATGLTFTAFVARLRVEKAKNLLLNPNYRVSEVGFAVGFESLTHFNRRFNEYVGESPTSYRQRIQRGLANGREKGTRPKASRAITFVNGTGASESLISAQPTGRTFSGDWFQPPNIAQPRTGKAHRNGGG